MGNLKSKSKIYIEVQRAKNSQDTSEKKKKTRYQAFITLLQNCSN